MKPNPKRTGKESEYSHTIGYFVEMAQYTLSEPPQSNEVEAFRRLMSYLVIRLKLFDSDLPQNNLAAGLAAETFLIYYRAQREFTSAAAFASHPQNWRPPPSSLAPPVYSLFHDLQIRVPDRFEALRNMDSSDFARLMLPKVIRDWELDRFSVLVSTYRARTDRVLH